MAAGASWPKLSWQEGDHDRVGDDHRDRCNDVIEGSDGADTINGRAGDDLTSALGGDDAIAGGLGNDWIDALPTATTRSGVMSLQSGLTLLVEATT
jgi:hypothetical protein